MSTGSATRTWLARYGSTMSFVWGVAEATLFFIIPDVAVGAVALFSWRRGLRAAMWAIAGALVGGTVLYITAQLAGDSLLRVVEAVPGIPPSMVEDVERSLAASGGWALVGAPFSGIPYKLYATEMALAGFSLPSLLFWTIPARAVRILPVALAVGVAGVVLRVDRRPRLWLALYAIGWIILYVAYFSAVGW